jgi:cytochrome bd-type quinol oxidase subunit 1
MKNLSTMLWTVISTPLAIIGLGSLPHTANVAFLVAMALILAIGVWELWKAKKELDALKK